MGIPCWHAGRPEWYLARMCGRYSLTLQGKKIVHGELNEVAIQLRTLAPRFNIAPGQTAPVIRMEDGRPRVTNLRWGLIPSWAKDPKIAWQCVNARSETVSSKPAFRSAFRKRRCLIPATGFFEWQSVNGKKQPWHFFRPEGDLIEFAGLWETWTPPGETAPIETFAICTTAPNRVAAPIHDRMPVILSEESANAWLDPASPAESLGAVMVPAPDDLLACYRVSPVVSNARNDVPECVEPVP